MQSIRDIAIEYGQQVEGLLERLGASGPVRGAGDMLDQVKGRLDEHALRTVRRFLRLRNKVVHNKPVEMPMPSREEVERAGRAAVAVLEGVLAARARQANATFHPPQQNETPGPVYRIREREGAYEVWVGPGGVWVVAGTREVLEGVRREAEGRLRCFPRLVVRAGRRARGLEARLRWGRKQLSPEEVLEAVRLLTQATPNSRPARGESTTANAERGISRPPGVRRVKLAVLLATFYVGPAGVLVVAEFPLIARTEAQRVWEGSGGAIPAVPAVLDPRLKEPQGRVDGVLALRDEGAIRDYLRGGHGLDEDEVDQVAGWLKNRHLPVPTLRDKRGRYRLRGDAVTEGRTKSPPAFVVELVPPSAPPAPSPHFVRRKYAARAVAVAKRLSWRVVFLPELALFALGAARHPGLWLVVGVLYLRFVASFGDDDLRWKRWVLGVVGGMEVGFSLMGVFGDAAFAARRGDWWFMLIMGLVFLLAGLASLFRGFWLGWCDRKRRQEWSAGPAPRSRVR
ncbi:MAG: hypothetical protein C4328_11990 [Meiothermus sp.]